MKAGCLAWLWLLLWCVGSGWWKRVRQRNRQEQMVAGVGYSWAELSLRKSLFGDGWLSSWALLHFLGSSELVCVLLVAGGWLEWEHIHHINWKHYKLAPLHLSVLYFQVVAKHLASQLVKNPENGSWVQSQPGDPYLACGWARLSMRLLWDSSIGHVGWVLLISIREGPRMTVCMSGTLHDSVSAICQM